MEMQHSRRAALGALASVPALAILPVAASSPSTTQLSALIEAHRAARAIFSNATEALEAAEPNPDIRVYYLGSELCAIGHSSRETLISEMEAVFQFELKKLSMLSRLSPEIGKAARGELERGRAVYIARIDEIFAGHVAVEKVWQAALDAEEEAILAICEHRCVSIEEIAIKAARFLRRFCRKGRKSNRLFDDRKAAGATRRPISFGATKPGSWESYRLAALIAGANLNERRRRIRRHQGYRRNGLREADGGVSGGPPGSGEPPQP
jgi:hypothetical protein